MKKKSIAWILAWVLVILMVSACASKTATTDTTGNAIVVRNVTLAENLDENFQAINPTTQFYPADTIYVSVVMAGRPKTGSLNGKFFLDDQLISEATLDLASVNEGVFFSVGEDTYAGFNLMSDQYWPVGTGYHFDLYVNGSKFGEYAYEVVQ